MGQQLVFRRIAVVGVGLIGGSVALAAKRADALSSSAGSAPALHVIGVDRGDITSRAREAGVIDEAVSVEEASASDDAAHLDALASCDLIVLAAPVSANLAWMDRLAAARVRAVVTDVGGTKRQTAMKAQALPALAFVGGHPMAGSERSGFAAASASLFDDRKWFLIPGADAAAAERVADWVRALGAAPTFTDADVHDRVMAAVSALPQVTASALMAVVGERVAGDGLRMAGPGLRDTTRLAGSAATWMTDGLAHNARDVADAIDALVNELRRVRDQLDTPERAADLFARAQTWRRHLLNS